MGYGGGGAAYIAMIHNAIKACGTIVKVQPDDFLQILGREEKPLVVRATGGLFTRKYLYLTSYRGLAFHCSSKEELPLPGNAEVIIAEKMSMPEI